MIDFQNGSVFKLKKVEDAKFDAELCKKQVFNQQF